MRNASEHLFDLIGTMKRTEKRYFKKFASRHQIGEKNNYVVLFDAIDQQKEYNEETLKKKFKGTPLEKRFPKIKHYLYHQVLKSLRSYYSSSTVTKRIRELIDDVEILYEKGLYRQCQRLLAKGEELAKTHETVPQYLEILEMKYRLYGEMEQLEEIEKNFDKDLQSVEQSLTQLKNLFSYKHLSTSLYISVKQDDQDQELIDWMNELMKSPLMESPERALSYHAKATYYYIKGFYAYLMKDIKVSLKWTDAMIRHLESDPVKLEEIKKKYYGMLNNKLIFSIELKDWEKAEATIEKLDGLVRSLPKKGNESIRDRIKIESVINRLRISIGKGNFPEGELQIRRADKILKNPPNGLKKEDALMLLFYSSLFKFIKGDYRAVIKAKDKVLQIGETKMGREFYTYIRILELMALFEKEDFDLLFYKSRAAFRYLQRRNRLFELEKTIIRAMQNQFPYHQGDKLKDSMHTLWEKLENFNEGREQKLLEELKFFPWLEHHLTGIPLSRLLKVNKEKEVSI